MTARRVALILNPIRRTSFPSGCHAAAPSAPPRVRLTPGRSRPRRRPPRNLRHMYVRSLVRLARPTPISRSLCATGSRNIVADHPGQLPPTRVLDGPVIHVFCAPCVPVSGTVPEAGRTMFAIASSATTIRRMPQPTGTQESASSSGSAVHSHLGWQGRCEGGHGLFHEGDDPVPVPAELHHRRPHPERRSCRGRRPSAPCAGALSPPAAQPAQPLTTAMTAVQPICRASVVSKHCTCAPDASTRHQEEVGDEHCQGRPG
ncbi:hypothetical protein AU375_02618 [Methylobacterium radiotolerans]|nr:hypothetical protein AU375_02618 [Methylobacterium radiotolerans]